MQNSSAYKQLWKSHMGKENQQTQILKLSHIDVEMATIKMLIEIWISSDK